jgi:hypothetical protein
MMGSRPLMTWSVAAVDGCSFGFWNGGCLLRLSKFLVELCWLVSLVWWWLLVFDGLLVVVWVVWLVFEAEPFNLSVELFLLLMFLLLIGLFRKLVVVNSLVLGGFLFFGFPLTGVDASAVQLPLLMLIFRSWLTQLRKLTNHQQAHESQRLKLRLSPVKMDLWHNHLNPCVICYTTECSCSIDCPLQLQRIPIYIQAQDLFWLFILASSNLTLYNPSSSRGPSYVCRFVEDKLRMSHTHNEDKKKTM